MAKRTTFAVKRAGKSSQRCRKAAFLFIIWKRDRVLAPEPREGRNVAQQKRNKKGRKEKTDRQKKKKKKKRNLTKPNREWKENGKAKEKKEKAKKPLRREGDRESRPVELAVDVMTSLSFSLHFDSIEWMTACVPVCVRAVLFSGCEFVSLRQPE